MPTEATIPPGKLHRLVRAAYLRADRDALRELRTLYAQHREEMERYAHRDGFLAALIADIEAGARV
jgi:isocitrate lyase